MPEKSQFVHLHVHTEYSLLDGLSHIEKLVAKASELNMPALAITDHGAMHGVIQFYRACQSAGIKPIIGMEGYLSARSMFDREATLDRDSSHLLLLAKNQIGYQNLLKISSAAELDGFYYRPRVDKQFLFDHAEGIIATSGCLAAEIPRLIERGRENEALKQIGWYQDVFGKDNFYLELQHHNIPEQIALNRWLADNHKKANVPLVATADVHYVSPDDYDLHDTLLCIQTGKRKDDEKRMRFSDNSFYLVPPDEMTSLFSEVPEAVQNTLFIAEMCDINLSTDGYRLPQYNTPDGYTPASYLLYLTDIGIQNRFGDDATSDILQSRLHDELAVINNMGFDSYFLIVWDLCEYARHHDIWWNVRGSGAGSLVAYCLGITSINPVKYGLWFERFLNPDRVSMPDIDLDFPDDRRDEMVNYTVQKYGDDHVAAIVTFGTLGVKGAIKDIARVHNVPYDLANQITAIVSNKAETPMDALKENRRLQEIYDNDGDVQLVFTEAQELQGTPRHTSVHAAGIIVGDRPLVEYTPLKRLTGGSYKDTLLRATTQFDMGTCESIGLLKIDFLGLSTLSVMRKCCALIAKNHGAEYTIYDIPYDETQNNEQERMLKKAFELLGSGHNIGVFQVEGEGMSDMLREMRPYLFEHIIAAVALYRPGPMQFIPTYIRRVRGDEGIDYRHPKLEPILKSTYGIITYQEQIIQIASQLFGYKPGEADLIRKAVSKKNADKLILHKKTFLERGPENGIERDVAELIWGDIETFADYGFNKAHAADYAKIAVQTAFLKANYPVEYMAACLQSHLHRSEKISTFLGECKRLDIPLLPVDINFSDYNFTLEDGAIRFGVGIVKQVGEITVEDLLADRNANGAFNSLEEFCERLFVHKINRRALENLIRVGAFRVFGDRAHILAAVDTMRERSKTYHKKNSSDLDEDIQQLTFFDANQTRSVIEKILDKVSYTPVNDREMLAWEKDLTGVYITARPVERYIKEFRELMAVSLDTVFEDGRISSVPNKSRVIRFGGEVIDVRTMKTKNGNNMAIATLEDWGSDMRFKAVFFPKVWEQYKLRVRKRSCFVVRGELQTDRELPSVLVDEFYFIT